MLRKQQLAKSKSKAIRTCEDISARINQQKVQWAAKAKLYVYDDNEHGEEREKRAGIVRIENDDQRLGRIEPRGLIPRPRALTGQAQVDEAQVLPCWARRNYHPDYIVHEDKDEQQGMAQFEEEKNIGLIDHLFDNFFKGDKAEQLEKIRDARKFREL